MERRAVLLFFICINTYFYHMYAVDIGSDTAPTRFNSQQVLVTGDRIAGFAFLTSGFALATDSTIATFDSVFPVSGNVGLGFGTLILNEDLIFHNQAAITSLGSIRGNNHTVALASTMRCIPSGEQTECSVDFLTNVIAPDDVLALDWNATSQYIAIGTPTSPSEELRVYSWNGSSLSFVTGVEFGTPVRAVKWHPTNNWVAVGLLGGGTNEVYIYSFSGVTLTLLSSVNIGAGGSNINSLAWRPQGDFLAIGCDENTQELIVYAVNGSGIFGASTSVDLTEDVEAVDWNYNGTYLVVGTEVNLAINELQVYSFTTTPALALDVSIDTVATVASLAWNKTSPNQNIIAAGLYTGSDALRIYNHTPASLLQLPTTSGVVFNIDSLSWHPNGTCLAVGLEQNAETEVRIYGFFNNTLVFDNGIELTSDVFAVAWAPSGRYLASGDETNALNVYKYNASFVNTNVTFSAVNLILTSDITFSDFSITFSSDSTIDGNNNTLTLAPTFSLIVEEGSSLLFKNIIIEGVRNSNIRGLDNASTFSFQNAQLNLNGNFTFNAGRLDIIQKCVISGGYSFIYTATGTTTIRGGSVTPSSDCSPIEWGSLIIDYGTTFSYAPVNNASDLLLLENPFAKIVLNGGTLFGRSLVLKRGTLEVDGESMLTAGTSITLGNNNVLENLNLHINPAAVLQVSGNIINKNV